jgi:hypothetical protein
MLSQGIWLADVKKKRDVSVSAEFRRALLTSEQVILNRAYIYNNSALSVEYRSFDDRRKAFGSLLKDGAIVPYLYAESSPTERPRGSGPLRPQTESLTRSSRPTEPNGRLRLDAVVPDGREWPGGVQLLSDGRSDHGIKLGMVGADLRTDVRIVGAIVVRDRCRHSR